MASVPFLPFPPALARRKSRGRRHAASGWSRRARPGASSRTSSAYLAIVAGGIAVNSATAACPPRTRSAGHWSRPRGHHDHAHLTATREVVHYLGADVVLVDIDPATLNIDPRAVRRPSPAARRQSFRHYAGLAADMRGDPRHRATPRAEGGRRARHALPTVARCKLVGTAGVHANGFSFYANQDHHDGRGRHARHADAAAREAREVCA